MTDHSDTAIPASEEEWRERLSAEEYEILREAGTEPAFSGDLLDVDEDGEFTCAGCGIALFPSDTKFDSNSGWPSFWDAIDDALIDTAIDRRHGLERIEIKCARCDGHLGHVFDDGPEPSGKRYCVNSAALNFSPATE